MACLGLVFLTLVGMKPDTRAEIFLLVKSLTEEESRAYGLTCASNPRKGGQNLYHRLFLALQQLSVWDNAAEKKLDANEAFYPAVWTRFRSHLLSFLREHEIKTNDLARLDSEVKEAEIMVRRGMYQTAIKKVPQLFEMAQSLEHFPAMLRLLELEQRFYFRLRKSAMGNGNSTLIQRMNDLQDTIADHNRLQVASLTAGTLVISRHWETQSALQEELDQQLHAASREPRRSTLSEMAEYNAKGLLQLSRGNFDEAYLCYGHLVVLWESHPHLLQSKFSFFLNCFQNYMNSCLANRRLDEFDSFFAKLSSLIPAQQLTEQIRLKESLYHLRLIYLLNTARFDIAPALIAEIEPFLDAHGAVLPLTRLLNFKTNIVLIDFFQENWPRVLAGINPLLQDFKEGFRADVYDLLRALQLIVHYELDHADLLPYLYRSARRFYGRKKNSPLITHLLELFSALLANPTEKEWSDAFSRFVAGLKHDAIPSLIPGAVEFACWGTSKVYQSTILAEFRNFSAQK